MSFINRISFNMYFKTDSGSRPRGLNACDVDARTGVLSKGEKIKNVKEYSLDI